MSYNKLPKEKLRSLLLLYPAFLSIVFVMSEEFDLRKLAVIIAVYILTVLLNIMSLNFLIDRIRTFRIFIVKIGIKTRRRLFFLLLGLLMLFLLEGRVNFLYQIIYIAVFISTDTYIGYLGRRYRQLLGKG